MEVQQDRARADPKGNARRQSVLSSDEEGSSSSSSSSSENPLNEDSDDSDHKLIDRHATCEAETITRPERRKRHQLHAPQGPQRKRSKEASNSAMMKPLSPDLKCASREQTTRDDQENLKPSLPR